VSTPASGGLCNFALQGPLFLISHLHAPTFGTHAHILAFFHLRFPTCTFKLMPCMLSLLKSLPFEAHALQALPSTLKGFESDLIVLYLDY
jgi:hypothetical protein